MPLEVADCFLWNSPKFISKKTIFPNSLPFYFLFESLSLCRIFAHERAKTFKPFFGYSIVKHLKNEKERQLLSLFRELLRYRSKNKFEFSKIKTR